MAELKEKLKEIIKPHTNPFEEGRRTSVDLREYYGAKNRKGESFSFKGLSTIDTYNLILKHFK